MASVNLDSLINDTILRQLSKAAELPLRAPRMAVGTVSTRLALTLLEYASTKRDDQRQPTLSKITQQAKQLATSAREVLSLLAADHRGPDGSLSAHVPVPSWLIADPACELSVVSQRQSGHWRGDEARDAMLAEAKIHIQAPSIFGAHDVARIAVAALRQLVALADSTQRHNSLVRLTSYDPDKVKLFAVVSVSYETLFRRPYVISQQWEPDGSKPAGPAIRWTVALFKTVAENAANTRHADALRGLAEWSVNHPGGLARRIRETRQQSAKARRHLYRRGSTE